MSVVLVCVVKSKKGGEKRDVKKGRRSFKDLQFERGQELCFFSFIFDKERVRGLPLGD